MGKAAKDQAIARRVSAGTMGSQGVMSAGELVGFYGCHLLDRPVRVRPPAEGRVPRSAVVECPCGNRHRAGISWRSLKDGEELDADTEVAA